MNKDQFYKQLEQPQLLSRDDIESLEELVEQYPYFASARVLLAKALHSANDHRFDDALQMAAVFAGDRKVLYDLVMKENLKKKIRDLDEAVSQETDEIESEEVEEFEVESVEETPKTEEEEIPEVEVEEKQVPDAVESEAEEIKPEEPKESLEEETEEIVEAEPETEDTEKETESVEAEKEGDKEKVYDEYEREILYEAINSSISKEVSEEQEPEEDTSIKEGKETKVEVREERQKEAPPSAAPTSFSEWLRKRASEIHYNEKAGDEKPSVPVEGIQKSESAREDSEEAKPRQDELIEQFIEREPKITPKKADMFSSENLAKMSVVEDESFVTETMAKIFAKQGNIRKAKRAYKLLSLKYPEKSIYFANQIKKLQGKK